MPLFRRISATLPVIIVAEPGWTYEGCLIRGQYQAMNPHYNSTL